MKKLLLITMLSSFVSVSSFASDVFKTTQDNSGLGTGNVITLNQEATFTLSGKEIKVGDYFPSMILKTEALADFDTSTSNGKVRVYNVLASIDTPVCVQQAKDLSAYIDDNSKAVKNIEMLAISADTAFAQMRFRKESNLEDNFVFLSDAINHEFGSKTGTQIKELGLLARSIIVVGKDNKVKHIQRVPELTTLPDLAKAISVANEYI